jgi:hypothetical protein
MSHLSDGHTEGEVADIGNGAIDIACESCGATLRLEESLRTAECAYCASPMVVERPASADRPDPAFVVGFLVDRERAVTAVSRWIGSRGPFVRSDFKKSTIKKTRGVYLPAYLYGAVADTWYEAEIGEDYTETETDTDSKGQRRTRRVTRTEYRELAGKQARYILDALVTASKGIPNEELAEIEPFDLRALRRYTPAILSGWLAEEPSLDPDACRRLAQGESIQRVGDELPGFMPGDSHHSLRFSTHLEDEIIDLVLLPVWVFSMRYAENKPPVRILMNGQTGKVHGKVPLSSRKIGAAVIFAFGLVATLLWLLNAF